MSDIDVEEWLTWEQKLLHKYHCNHVMRIDSVQKFKDVKALGKIELENCENCQEKAKLRKRVEELEDENEKLREGLEFYADEEHLETGDRGGSVPKDFGRKAKQILKEVSDD